MMRDPSKRPSKVLDVLLREAREDLVPHDRGADGDFSAVDAKLFTRIAQEASSPVESRLRQSRRPPVESRLRQSRRPPAPSRGWLSFSPARLWGGVALVAAAAAVMVLARPSGTTRGVEAANPQTTEPVAVSTGTHSEPGEPSLVRAGSAASLREREGRGEIRIAGNLAEPGHGLSVADTVETTDARALFVSGHAGNVTEGDGRPAVTWLIEEQSHIEVENAQSPLVL
ncbi:MAG TPA: hypothetical protein VNO21_04685, partial [Polyangiaceae bacterium]|nr:hypothetical protein [Polyangiaceae bacterium]